MDYETLIRLIFGVLVVTLFLNHLGYGRQFPNTNKIGGLREMIVPVAGCLWASSLIAYLSGFEWFDVRVPLPYWVRCAGISLMILCLPLSIWVYRTLGVHFSTRLQLLKDHQLVDTGPYRFVRHPMYSTFFLCAVAASLASANPIVGIASIGMIMALSLRIKREETMLLERFGGEYREYMQRTGAIVPKLHLLAR